MRWPFADAGPLLRALFRCPAASGGWNPGAKTGGTDGLARFFVCAGGAPGPVRCDDPALPSPSFSAAPSCRTVLPLRLAAPSCRSVLPLRPAAPSCRPVLPPRPAAPPSGFGRIRPDGACHFLPLPSVWGKSACCETPFLHDLTRAATKKRPRRGSFSSCRVSAQPQI